jgi:amino acid transporter
VAFALFFIPEVVAVLALSKRFPEEGGLYTWANRQFGPTHGFISGWYYWTGNLFYFPMQLVYLAGVIAYAARGADSHLVDDKTFLAAVALGWLALVTAVNVVGLGVGKWLPNVGAVCTAFTAILIASAGVVAWQSGASAPARPDRTDVRMAADRAPCAPRSIAAPPACSLRLPRSSASRRATDPLHGAGAA